MPETLEEFENMLCYFRDHDMNGNGDASDEIPYMECAGMEGIFTPLGGFFPANSSASAYGCVAGEDGQCQFYFHTPEFREGLAYLHELYTEGLLSDQTFTISPEERCRYTSRGQQGSSVGVAYMIRESDYERMDLAGLGENGELAIYRANQAYSPYLIPSGWPDLVWASGELADCASAYSELEKLIEDHVTEWYTSFILGTRDIGDDAQ